MKDSPFYDEIRAEGTRDAIKQALEVRFGREAGEEFRTALNGIHERERLSELLATAIRCRRVSEFRRELDKTAAAH